MRRSGCIETAAPARYGGLVPRQKLPQPYLGRLKALRRERRRRAVVEAAGQGHTLSRWVHAFWLPEPYPGFGHHFMWARVCGRCGHRLVAFTYPWWVAVDASDDAMGAATSEPCVQPTLFDQLPDPCAMDFPLPVQLQYVSVLEAIGMLPAPQIGTKKNDPPRYCQDYDAPEIDPRLGLCRQCGLPHPSPEA